jgi:hypothetical protein
LNFYVGATIEFEEPAELAFTYPDVWRFLQLINTNVVFGIHSQTLHDRIVKLSLERKKNMLKSFSSAERKILINFFSRMHAQIIDTNVTGKQRDI